MRNYLVRVIEETDVWVYAKDENEAIKEAQREVVGCAPDNIDCKIICVEKDEDEEE